MGKDKQRNSVEGETALRDKFIDIVIRAVKETPVNFQKLKEDLNKAYGSSLNGEMVWVQDQDFGGCRISVLKEMSWGNEAIKALKKIYPTLRDGITSIEEKPKLVGRRIHATPRSKNFSRNARKDDQQQQL